ncbi:hypothetical protein NC651_015091 [Populus alba x Populus x berolinensis]|nr:hypothetical protein NC651_015091 [Populus alba x Populus x berolinensis]
MATIQFFIQHKIDHVHGSVSFDSPYVASGFTTTTSSTAVSSLCAGHDYVCSSYVGVISIFPGPIALLHGATIDCVNTLHIERMKEPVRFLLAILLRSDEEMKREIALILRWVQRPPLLQILHGPFDFRFGLSACS